MKIGIPDDYAEVVRTLASVCQDVRAPVSIWTDAVSDLDAQVNRFKDVRRWCCCASARRSRRPCTRGCRIAIDHSSAGLIRISTFAACTAHGVACARR